MWPAPFLRARPARSTLALAGRAQAARSAACLRSGCACTRPAGCRRAEPELILERVDDRLDLPTYATDRRLHPPRLAVTARSEQERAELPDSLLEVLAGEALAGDQEPAAGRTALERVGRNEVEVVHATVRVAPEHEPRALEGAAATSAARGHRIPSWSRAPRGESVPIRTEEASQYLGGWDRSRVATRSARRTSRTDNPSRLFWASSARTERTGRCHRRGEP